MGRLLKTRSVVETNLTYTTKWHHDPAVTRYELQWYQRVPWAAPLLIDADPDKGWIKLATYPLALHSPDRPAGALHRLLQELSALGIHHRDVHVGNIVLNNGEPLLIDWETAVIDHHEPSYDLYGPAVSGVPVPEIHSALTSGYHMWWSAPHPMSIRAKWGTDVPASMV